MVYDAKRKAYYTSAECEAMRSFLETRTGLDLTSMSEAGVAANYLMHRERRTWDGMSEPECASPYIVAQYCGPIEQFRT